jgi:outer membrane lipoprotein-sorting protein
MKKLILMAAVVALLAASASAQGKQADLERVLALLDKTSETFKSLQTDFSWDQYQKVVDEHDTQSGVMYFKRNGATVDVAAVIKKPIAKKLLFKAGDLQVYIPKTGQTTHYDTRKNRQTAESFLALGFGGRGSDLTKNFEVRYAGTEPVGGKSTYKLELTPISADARRMFPLITLWINQQTGMSEQQKLDQGEGDYRLARYTSIQINPKALPPDAFDLKAK